MKLIKHYENCFLKYGDSPKGVDWENKGKADIRYSVMLDIVTFSKKQIAPERILDYGCGLGHLWEYIYEHSILLKYYGYDASSLFIQECKKKHPLNNWFDFNPPKCDYVIMNGVFTERWGMTEASAWNQMRIELLKTWELCEKGVAFNMMSKNVDWEREDLFHISKDKLTRWVCNNLSRDFIIRNDYGLYEYTMYVYKKS
jgi:hypothetical protein